jgi:hypothetical protein
MGKKADGKKAQRGRCIINVDNPPLKNWIPYKLAISEGQLNCHWLNTRSLSFTEPFFEDTISKCLSMMSNPRFKSASDLPMISHWADELPPVEPAVIIFHISRCGSTLLSQLLAIVPQHIVLSEVPIFDQILRLPLTYNEFDEKSVDILLASAVKFYGQNKLQDAGIGSSLFIKADCWHLFFYEQLRKLYPQTPFIVLYRRPEAVFRSHSKQPGMHVVRSIIEPSLFGFEPGSPVFETAETYMAAVIEAYLKKGLALAEADHNYLLLNYEEGPMQMIRKMAAFANIPLSTEELAIMEERSQFHSKNPGQRFSEEAANHIPAVLHDAMIAYEHLDKKRLSETTV